MNDMTPSDFAGLLHAHKQQLAVQKWVVVNDDCKRQWVGLDDDYEREIPLEGLYLYVRKFLCVLSVGVSFGIITYLWSLL
jgi:hypothetical protein